MSKITMPAVEMPDAYRLQLCHPYLVVHKDTRAVRTVIVGRDDTVLFFDLEDGIILHGTVDYLKGNYDIIRAYQTGDTLSYTQG